MSASKRGAVTVALFGDSHVNSTIGLCTPRVVLDDGGEYRYSAGQSWLWRQWKSYCDEVKREAKGSRLYVFVNGDAVEADVRQRSHQLVSRNKATMLRLAADVLEPILNIADRVFVIRGTGAHTGRGSQFEEKLADDVGAERTPDGQRSWWYWLGEISGVLCEVAHHTTGSGRAWTAGGGAVRLAAETVIEYGGNGERIPALVFRSHTHRHTDSGENVTGCRAVTLPAWSLATEHSHRTGAGVRLAHVGGAIVRCEDGGYNLRVIRYVPRRQEIWREN